MKNLIVTFLSALTIAPAFASAASPGIAELVGNYSLKQNVSGFCYPELFVKQKHFLGHSGSTLGIYGGPGLVLAELVDINEGEKRNVQTDPFLGRDTGYSVTSSSVVDGKVRATHLITDLVGNVKLNRDLNGTFDGSSFAFEHVELNSINGNDYRAGSCVYGKKMN